MIFCSFNRRIILCLLDILGLEIYLGKLYCQSTCYSLFMSVTSRWDNMGEKTL